MTVGEKGCESPVLKVSAFFGSFWPYGLGSRTQGFSSDRTDRWDNWIVDVYGQFVDLSFFAYCSTVSKMQVGRLNC